MPLVAPSILSCDFSKLKEEIKMVEEAGADLIHIDVMDGHFVPNITFGPLICEAVNKITDLPLDVHLMIENPEKYYERFIEAGADYISFHIEAVPEPTELLRKIRENGVKAGLTLNPPTPLSKILPYLKEVDFVLVMTVNPGFGGQKMIEDALSKIPELKKYGVIVEVDGGIKKENAEKVVKLGADIIVSGSGIFKHENPPEVIKYIKSLKKD